MLYKQKYIEKNYKEFYNELMSMFADSPNYNEKIYRYIHNVTEKPRCPICGKQIPYRNSPAGYGKYCSQKCMALSEERKQLCKNTKLNKYGDVNYNNADKATETMNEKYGGRGLASKEIRKKSNNVCIQRYGVDNVFKLNEFQQKGHKTKLKKYGDPHYRDKEKIKQTNIERYGVDNPMKSDIVKNKFKKTMLERYGVEYAMLNKELVNKLSESLTRTHREGKYDYIYRHKKNPSNIERQFKKYLDDNNIEYKFQYRSDKYPFLCDFYITKYDLYIEIQGHWTHGSHPFIGDEEDLKTLNKWRNKNTKFYNQAIYVWTDLDVKKRNIANQNKINYLEVFSIDPNKCIELFNNKINKV